MVNKLAEAVSELRHTPTSDVAVSVFFYRPQATDRLGQFGHRRGRVC